MDKILKKYTTIPSHLYVHRTADKQLRSIIEEMERPGYVLVARQMGKTNLLFNAKRELENDTHLFAYVDLSNLLETSQECFRYIIDMIIEPNVKVFKDAANKIQYIRSSIPALAPHIEFTNSLRTLFKEFSGKLIIILDEIDALTSVSYSDQIFAQIRSTYFAGRSNFPELNNLTYVLSGVVEPSELIKDKNKSPFNIGEKIYLDDFSYDEHLQFIKLSKLNISDDLSNGIFKWTNGNPRMTFDICSELENIIISKSFASINDIDTVIKKLYLINYDLAPIDHIRELVKNNNVIREAVAKLQRKNYEISDEIKRKLYLYGIINSDFDSSQIKIKNRIISESLSLEWITSIDLESKPLYEIGYDRITSGNYNEGISLLLQFLESGEKISSNEKSLCFYKIGYAYHKLENYEESNKYLFKQIIDLGFLPSIHYYQKMYIGVNYIALGNTCEGFKYLENVIVNYKKGAPYINSLLNIALNIDTSNEDNYSKAHSYFDEIVNKIDDDKDDMSDKEVIKLKTLANYYKADLFVKKSDIENAKIYFEKAKEISSITYKPFLTYFDFIFSNNKILLDNIVRQIVDNKLEYDKDETPICFKEKHLILYLELLVKSHENDLIDILVDYAFRNLYKFKEKAEIYYLLGYSILDQQCSEYFYDKILEFDTINLDYNKLKILYRNKTIYSIKSGNKFIYFFDKYKEFEHQSQLPMEIDDITAYIYAVKSYSDHNQNNKALELLFEIESRFDNLKEELKPDTILVYYWFAIVYTNLKEKQQAIAYADLALKLIDNVKKNSKRLSILNEESLEHVRTQTLSIKGVKPSISPLRITSKINRNDKITVRYIETKKIVIDKYKKLETDINEGKCEIIKKV